MKIDSGFASFACNPYGSMNAVQVYQMDSIEQTDRYIEQFERAIEAGLDPNNAAVQEKIFSSGTLPFAELLPTDQTRLLSKVEAAYKMRNKSY